MEDGELIKKLIEAVDDFAWLNCSRPPMGKHYKDEECGECTSCRARVLLKEIGVKRTQKPPRYRDEK